MKAKRLLTAIIAGLMLFSLTACNGGETNPAKSSETGGTSEAESSQFVRKTGEITLKLFPEIAPVAVQNFIDLAENGYYDGKLVHRIIPRFMLQGGSPRGDGMSDPSYDKYFSIEPSQDAVHHYGALCMANAGPDYNSQQFYIVNNKDGAHELNGGYTVFGQALTGFDVIDGISGVQIGYGDRPVQNVVIEDVEIKIAGDDYPEPDADAIKGNVGGEVKLYKGDKYVVMTFSYYVDKDKEAENNGDDDETATN